MKIRYQLQFKIQLKGDLLAIRFRKKIIFHSGHRVCLRTSLLRVVDYNFVNQIPSNTALFVPYLKRRIQALRSLLTLGTMGLAIQWVIDVSGFMVSSLIFGTLEAVGISNLVPRQSRIRKTFYITVKLALAFVGLLAVILHC